MNKYVVKISGKFVDPTNTSNLDRIRKYAQILSKHSEIIGVVVGGGDVARSYINSVKDYVSNSEKDYIGLKIAQLNALVLGSLVKYYGREVLLPIPTTWDEVYRFSSSSRLIILGGMEPGQSTDAVTMKLAEFLGVRNVIVLSNVDGVYTSDPRVDPNAKLIRDLTYTELRNILKDNEEKPGKYFLLDSVAINLAQRSKINIILTNGENPIILEKIISGELDSLAYSIIHH